MKLTEQDRVNLGWMIKCNKARLGFLGPTVRKLGDLPELSHLVEAGLAIVVSPYGRGSRVGYWITDAGRAALGAIEPRPNAFAFDDDGNVIASAHIPGPVYLDVETGVIRSTPVERGKK